MKCNSETENFLRGFIKVRRVIIPVLPNIDLYSIELSFMCRSTGHRTKNWLLARQIQFWNGSISNPTGQIKSSSSCWPSELPENSCRCNQRCVSMQFICYQYYFLVHAVRTSCARWSCSERTSTPATGTWRTTDERSREDSVLVERNACAQCYWTSQEEKRQKRQKEEEMKKQMNKTVCVSLNHHISFLFFSK